ncbi:MULTISPECIES: hypothetical protein [Prochlorococcus]|uniref:Uncharacterized protein n=1 Tax=Prochlorococcus marinus (strain SARG / CCMP1375 / SS120) TaxID=167539 RepID=Q7VBC4_PROMA|nr:MULTISPECIES: hypothetical protein [Prochlorococcus]AAQ00217.1 Predicted protein family PM-20 [Prochlorococcus marinus subsp. marinus str. CCMP1375]
MATWVIYKQICKPSQMIIDPTHLLDFATQLPHPSDIGIIKPTGGFNLGAALCGLGAFFGASQFFYYSDDSKRIDPWAKRD